MIEQVSSDVLLAILQRLGVADVLAIGSTCTALRALTGDDVFWRDLALRKWGHRVDELRAAALAAGPSSAGAMEPASSAAALEPSGPPAAEPAGPSAEATATTRASSSWKQYAVRRMNLRAIRQSPLALGQEQYPDPWAHILCCVLCSRTSGSNVIRDTITRFFAAFPTPTAALEASDSQITDIIHPLGLQPNRLRAIRSVSENFLATEWEDPSEFYGCGKFVADSWRIFCRGDISGAGVEDRNLKAYVAWAKKEVRRERGAGAAGNGGEADDPLTASGGEEEEEEEEQQRQRKRQKRSEDTAAAGSDRARRLARRELAGLDAGGGGGGGSGRRRTRSSAAAGEAAAADAAASKAAGARRGDQRQPGGKGKAKKVEKQIDASARRKRGGDDQAGSGSKAAAQRAKRALAV